MRLAGGGRLLGAALVGGILLGAAGARADAPAAPERLLAADSILYWRFDGWTPHQAAFDRTAFADVLRGGTGEFLEFLQQFACKQLSNSAVSQPLLAGMRPSELKILRSAAKQLPLLWPAIEQHGVAIGIESAGNQQSPRLTVVLPQGKPLYLVARLLATQFANAPVERRIHGRLVLVSQPQPVGGAATNQATNQTGDQAAAADSGEQKTVAANNSPTTGAAANNTATAAKAGAVGASARGYTHPLAQPAPKEPQPTRMLAWAEGGDLVIVVAAQTSDEMVASVLGRSSRNLLNCPSYEAVTAFNDYEVLSRGFVDVRPALREVAKVYGDDLVTAIAAEAGFDSVRQISWHTGIEGRHHRYTIDIDIPGKRTGALNLFTGPSLRPGERLPPLPPELDQFHLFSLQTEGVGEIVRGAAQSITGLIGADDAAKARAAGASAKKQDVNIQRELVDSLGTRVLVCNSPSEGPFFTGSAVAIEIKKSEQLRKILGQVEKRVASHSDDSFQILHCRRHGVDVVSVRLPVGIANNFPTQIWPMPSYAILNGWLVAAAYPQTIDGFILRSASQPPQLSASPTSPVRGSGTYQTWQPSPLLQQIVAKAARQSPAVRILSIHETDPRPLIDFVLCVSPIAGSLINASSGGDQFDNRKIPNAQSVVEPLYPNVSIVTDDGRRVRIDGYKSSPFPFDSSLVLVAGYMVIMNF